MEYTAKSKEKTFAEAACNGHTFIFGRTLICKISKRHAKFFDAGKAVWCCNANYARHNFELQLNVELKAPRFSGVPLQCRVSRYPLKVV